MRAPFSCVRQVRDLISEGTSGQFTARGGQIDFDFFCKLMRKKVRDDDTEAELKDAFRVLDKVGQGWIGVDEMRRICKARAARCGPLNLTPLP